MIIVVVSIVLVVLYLGVMVLVGGVIAKSLSIYTNPEMMDDVLGLVFALFWPAVVIGWGLVAIQRAIRKHRT